jgi:hypothetical protein
VKKLLPLLGVLWITGGALGVGQTDVDRDMLAKIRTEGLERSQAVQTFEKLTIDIGGRLTGSPSHQRAVEFARERLTAYGLSNVNLEPWKFGRGWTLERLTVEMIEPRYQPLIGYADGWSAATPGEIVAQPIFVGGKSAGDLQAIQSQLKGAIVMTAPMLSNFVRRDRPQPSDPSYVPGSAAYATSEGRRGAPPAQTGQAGRAGQTGQTGRAGQASQAGQAGAGQTGRAGQASQAGQAGGGRGAPAGPTTQQVLRDAGAGVLLKPSIGEHGTVFVTGRDGGAGAIPSVTLSAEHYNMIALMLERKIPVKLRVNVQSKFYDNDGNSHNVIAELPGVDPAVRDEVVMIGAHLDSWHTGVGATDNADGSTTMLEAMRILKAVGARPRRTIRVALWSGEEQGLLGSRAWVQQHLAGEANRAAREKFNVYFNIDNGYGPIYGFYLQNMESVRSTFDAWLEPLKDLGARRNVIEGVGSTDHLSFIEAGVPGFNPIQDYGNYDIRTHHTNMDTVERLNPKDISQAAIVMATFAYNAAMADQRIPRLNPVAR